MVFCFENCSDLLWEWIVLFFKFDAEGRKLRIVNGSCSEKKSGKSKNSTLMPTKDSEGKILRERTNSQKIGKDDKI